MSTGHPESELNISPVSFCFGHSCGMRNGIYKEPTPSPSTSVAGALSSSTWFDMVPFGAHYVHSGRGNNIYINTFLLYPFMHKLACKVLGYVEKVIRGLFVATFGV